MVRKLLRICIVLVLIAAIFGGFFLYGLYFAVDRPMIDNQTLASTKIPKALNGKTIAYFSDIKYKEFMDKKRLQKMVDKLKEAHADIVIFGGDVFSDVKKFPYDSQDIKDITALLQQIEAPLGKFAVLGDMDMCDEETQKQVTELLYASDFEVLTNQNLQIRAESSEGITLIALDPLINGDPDVNSAFSGISEEEFNLLITHCPDIITNTEINTTYLDAVISGHSLGGQVYIPLLGSLRKIEGAQRYHHGTYNVNTTTLYVSNGWGTVGTDMRLFAPPQILVFRLEYTDKQGA